MDNWTLLSAGFDAGEEAGDGGSRTTATPWRRGGTGGADASEGGKKMRNCARMHEERARSG